MEEHTKQASVSMALDSYRRCSYSLLLAELKHLVKLKMNPLQQQTLTTVTIQ
jgi:hypothetical protein